jgi:hypothetical protein
MAVTGMTGQSLGLTTWCAPKVYQTTTSVFVMDQLAAVYAGTPLHLIHVPQRVQHQPFGLVDRNRLEIGSAAGNFG